MKNCSRADPIIVHINTHTLVQITEKPKRALSQFPG